MGARQVVLLIFSKSSHPVPLLSRQQPALLNPLAATLMNLPASAANKRLTAGLTPLDATLTKNRGVAFQSSNGFLRGSQPSNLQTFQPSNSFLVSRRSDVRRSDVATIFRPVFSIACALFQVPSPLTPLLATLTKTPGCTPTIPIPELASPLTLRPFDSWTLRPLDAPTFLSPAHR
jgi:hypothetical protein